MKIIDYPVIPIGKQFINYQQFIVNPNNPYLLTIPGSIGELYIGGPCVFSGYLNQPQLSQKVLLKLPVNNYLTVLYKTGDLVRLNNNNEVEFIGRVDF